MFEESNQNGFYTDRIRGRVKLVTLQAVWASGVAVQDNATTSPNSTITSAAAVVSFTFNKGDFAHFVSANLTTGTALTFVVTTLDPATGTGSITFSGTPADGRRIYLTLLVGRTG